MHSFTAQITEEHARKMNTLPSEIFAYVYLCRDPESLASTSNKYASRCCEDNRWRTVNRWVCIRVGKKLRISQSMYEYLHASSWVSTHSNLSFDHSLLVCEYFRTYQFLKSYTSISRVYGIRVPRILITVV